MSAAGWQLAAAAEGFLGVPFRLHGRDPAHGLDCVGLCHGALAAIGVAAPAPRDYALRNLRMPDPGPWVRAAGLDGAGGNVERGDIVCVRLSPLQVHLMIAVGGADFIHAHAGLRRVVKSPAPAGAAILHHWRLCS